MVSAANLGDREGLTFLQDLFSCALYGMREQRVRARLYSVSYEEPPLYIRMQELKNIVKSCRHTERPSAALETSRESESLETDATSGGEFDKEWVEDVLNANDPLESEVTATRGN